MHNECTCPIHTCFRDKYIDYYLEQFEIENRPKTFIFSAISRVVEWRGDMVSVVQIALDGSFHRAYSCKPEMGIAC